jgi:hypothetical protein
MKTKRARELFYLLVIGLALPATPGLVHAGSTHPYYQRKRPAPQQEANFATDHIDVRFRHQPSYPNNTNLADYNNSLDARAAAVIRHAVDPVNLRISPDPNIIWQDGEPHHIDDSGNVNAKAGDGLFTLRDLLEMKWYDDEVPTFYTVTSKALPALAYADYFPHTAFASLGDSVSQAIMAASPGWCGTFGPKDGSLDLLLGGQSEGNYDMTEMHLIPMAYAYYDELSPDARERLITQLLAQATIHRINEDDLHTAGGSPDDWTRAGYFGPLGVKLHTLDETENHILAILVGKYLTNQLLYQRDHSITHDNRRNGSDNRPNCTDLVLELLRRILRDDFSEYNAKPYQEETRWPLLNLCSYAYDHEVRLAARMVLDYISAHFAVSTSDAGRMVPFRRRNEGPHNSTIGGGNAPMSVGLVDSNTGGDPLLPYFAIQTGNLRSFEFEDSKHTNWGIDETGQELALEALSDYRLPPMIHDLFINDQHRRFFQRLRRTARDEAGGNRNCDNMEIYAGSPSYLITAGGQPATWAIDPRALGIAFGPAHQQLGFAVTTSFMPTGIGPGTRPEDATGLIQFGVGTSDFDPNAVENYGVAPDFACGYSIHLPPWASNPDLTIGRFYFFNHSSRDPALPGYYLALHVEDNGFSLLEAYDTYLNPGITFDEFTTEVWKSNGLLQLQSNVEARYITQGGLTLHFVIWNNGERNNTQRGTRILQVEYSPVYPFDGWGDAGNDTSHFLNGTVLNSPAEGVVEISDPYLKQKIVLDMSDPAHPRRISETGEIEQAGYHNEVWVDFDWTGPNEGDFYRPYNTLAAAVAAVADGGVIKIAPGRSSETITIQGTKKFRVVAPIGGVQLGVR